MKRMCVSLLSLGLLLGACSAGGIEAPEEGTNISLRNLATTNTSAPAREHYVLQGDLIPTPSDPKSRFYMLHSKHVPFSEREIAVLRQERAGRIAYARVELDCKHRLFHVVGVGNRRSFAETTIAYDGPLRPIEGLPLRQEIASFICQRNGTPLAVAG